MRLNKTRVSVNFLRKKLRILGGKTVPVLSVGYTIIITVTINQLHFPIRNLKQVKLASFDIATPVFYFVSNVYLYPGHRALVLQLF